MATHIRGAYDTNTGALLPQPRGFRPCAVSGMRNPPTLATNLVYVRIGYRAEKCDGEAHSNPHIDHCMTCLTGVWGIKAVKTAGDK